MYTRVQQLHRPEIETVCSEQRDKLMHRVDITMQGSESVRKREREIVTSLYGREKDIYRAR